MSQALLAFDTNRIKSYVFATPTLKEIRAASAILDKLNRHTMLELVGGDADKCIYANGGGGLFLVDEAQAVAIKSAVERAYREQHAAVTGAILEGYQAADELFQSQFKKLSYRLRLAKDQTSGERLPLTHPYLHFCESCGREYAETHFFEPVELICARCHLKLEEDRRMKSGENVEGSLLYYRKLIMAGETFGVQAGLWPYLLSQLKAAGYPLNCHRPEDFDELAKQSKTNGYMGLIYADGDGMGQQLDEIKSIEQLREFARTVDNSLYQATVEAIQKHLLPQSTNDIWPFDVLMLGGDDLIMVTRAESALAVGKMVMERFAEIARPYHEKYQTRLPLRVSVSVVIAHAKYPFGALQKLAESGLKFAKKTATKQRQTTPTFAEGLLNFLVVSSASHLDFGEYYQHTLTHREKATSTTDKTPTESIIYRTQRPYTAANLQHLLNQIERVQNVPRSKLEQLRQAIFKSRSQAALDSIMTILRLRDKKQRNALLDLFGSNIEEQINLPWFPKGSDWVTPILDIAELIDFVPRTHEKTTD